MIQMEIHILDWLQQLVWGNQLFANFFMKF